MNLSNEIKELQGLHEAGTLTDEEFARAKDTVLASAEPLSEHADIALLKRQIEQVRLQGEIDRVDREWEVSSQKWMTRGKYGGRSAPTQGLAFGGAFCIICLGLFGLTVASASRAPTFMMCYGIFWILFGVAFGIGMNHKAERYEEAQLLYERRRAELLAQKERMNR